MSLRSWRVEQDAQDLGPWAEWAKVQGPIIVFCRNISKHTMIIKANKVLRVKGKQKYIDVISVNITTCHDTARDWLCEQTADIILIQEHHMFYRGQFGLIPGYTMVFSPARRTMYSARGWETSEGGCYTP